MVKTFTEGFDYYPNFVGAAGMSSNGWTWTSNTGTPPNNLVAGRFGGQAFRNTVRVGSGYVWNQYKLFLDAATGQDGAGLTGSFGVAYASTTDYRMFALGQNGGQCLTFIQNAGGSISVYRGDGVTLLGTTAAGVVVSGVYLYLELEFFIDNAAGYLHLYKDDVSILSLTGIDTMLGSETTINTFRLPSSGDVMDMYFDDMYLSDSATRLGPSKIETLRADADTATKTWIPNSGSVNFSRVNETLVDGNTSYVETATVGAEDLYDIGGLSSTPAIIHTANLVGCIEKTDAGARTASINVNSGGSYSAGTAFALAGAYVYAVRNMQLDPNGSIAWTPSAIGLLKIGQKLVS